MENCFFYPKCGLSRSTCIDMSFSNGSYDCRTRRNDVEGQSKQCIKLNTAVNSQDGYKVWMKTCKKGVGTLSCNQLLNFNCAWQWLSQMFCAVWVNCFITKTEFFFFMICALKYRQRCACQWCVVQNFNKSPVRSRANKKVRVGFFFILLNYLGIPRRIQKNRTRLYSNWYVKG
jgi:hypothetical protein